MTQHETKWDPRFSTLSLVSKVEGEKFQTLCFYPPEPTPRRSQIDSEAIAKGPDSKRARSCMNRYNYNIYIPIRPAEAG
jgi:hypothetical protein